MHALAAIVAAVVSPGFTAHVDNPWFPLKPGTRWVYTGVKDEQPSRDVVVVLHRTETIAGAPCIAVSDRLYVHGRLAERTTDWYSQDARGNVWYFGEQTAELDAKGHVTSTEGTWKAGVDGARAGLYMPARPHLGQSARQEFYAGHAEDHFRVVGIFRGNAVLTKEWTPLEPGVIDHKLYVRGVGTVVEQTVRGGSERNELATVTPTR
ncbi:MAG TPA: hypothetical protein VFA56_12365 [Gaiellaceae bacterium]|nr:hypothetical protein [Gaiellaceae bacterium]